MRFRTVVRSIEGARKQLASNLKMAATPMNYKSEIGQPILFDVILDISGSMRPFYDELVDCFNDIMIPSLREAAQRHRGSIRIGCLLFSTRLVPAWHGYKSLNELGLKPLKRDMFERKGLQSKTALFRAMQTGIFWTVAAMERMQITGRGELPKGKIVVFTDGFNNNLPKKENTVKKALNSIDRLYSKNLQTSIVFLNTDDGLKKKQFEKMCEQTGFSPSGFIEIAKDVSQEEKRLSFHNQMHNLFRAH